MRLPRTTIDKATKLLIEYVVDELGPVYRRPPIQREFERIFARCALRGMPGCQGSLDCSHCEWAGCPEGRVGTPQDRNGKRTIVLEAICDRDLWIYHVLSGAPGSLNDIHALYKSPLYMDVMAGKWPPTNFPFTVNGNTRTLLYYWLTGFIQVLPSLPHPTPNPRRGSNGFLTACKRRCGRTLSDYSPS